MAAKKQKKILPKRPQQVVKPLKEKEESKEINQKSQHPKMLAPRFQLLAYQNYPLTATYQILRLSLHVDARERNNAGSGRWLSEFIGR